jgi:gluconate 2-dehydrogenase gamma chain
MKRRGCFNTYPSVFCGRFTMEREQTDLNSQSDRTADVRPAADDPQQSNTSAYESSSPFTTPLSRGRLFRLTGAGIKVGVLTYAGIQALSGTRFAAAAPAPFAPAALPPLPQAESGSAADLHHQPLRFFNSAQAAVITAMAERIFPADSTGPGATDAHVVDYIDGQLAGDWGWGSRMYLRGPFFPAETSGHGWQSPMNPRDTYTDSLAGLDAYCQATYQNSFDQLSTTTQDTVLTALFAGKVSMTISSTAFFSMFLQNVKEGLFSDPIYGGNYNFIGWKWVRFPGNPMAYGDPYATYIDQYNYPYNVAPQGLSGQAY